MFYTPRLMLRPMDVEADAIVMGQRLNDPEFMRSVSLEAPKLLTRDGVKKFMENRIKLSEESKLPFLIICLKPDRFEDLPENLGYDQDFAVKSTADSKTKVVRYPMIGTINIRNPQFSYSNRDVQLGIAFDRAHRGKGFGTEVMRWAEEYVFDVLGLNRLELELREDNLQALKCYEKVGFVREGLKRKCFWERGEWKNVILMAILAEEWKEARDKRKNEPATDSSNDRGFG